MNHQELYESKRTTLDGALHMLRSGDAFAVSGELCEPAEFLGHLDRVIGDLEDVTLFKVKKGDGSGYPFMRLPDIGQHLNIVSLLFDAALRKSYAEGDTSFLPSNLHDAMLRRTQYRPFDLFVAMATPMDENGMCYVSGCGMYEEDAYRTAGRVILEVNPNLPKFHGSLAIPVSRVDALYEVDYPVTTFPRVEPTELDRRIGAFAADLVHDGDCIQLGLGGMPNAVGYSFFDKKDLGLHTELFTPIMGDLIEAGVITGARKQIDVGKHVGNFVLGDEKLYRILSQDPNVVFSQASYTNDPFVIAKNDNVVSLNTALEIDLTGQVCSESIGARQYSGTGGAFDFAFGAQHSKGGRGILAMASTAKGGTMSKIKPILTPGAVVSISRNVVDIIITEYGVACLRGRSVRERAEQLIAIAHPDFRDELRFEAKKLLYI